MSKILIIEDEEDMQFILSDNLRAEGHDVDLAAGGREGLRRALEGGYGLILLDIMLPDLSGLEICKMIRARDRATPILMLTAKGDEIDKVVGLEVGADDYITKPFRMRELLARVKAALRRSGRLYPEAVPEVSLGELRIDFQRQEVSVGGRLQRLTPYESELLRFLAAHRGEVVSRERILETVWSVAPSPSNRTVDNFVARLSQKIETDPSRPRHVLTVHGEGYKLL
jgi:DNA-binding response OmpR family regulator